MWNRAPAPAAIRQDEFLGTGISDVTHISAAREYFEEAMTWVDEGQLSLQGAMSYVRASLRHHYYPKSFPEVVVADFYKAA